MAQRLLSPGDCPPIKGVRRVRHWSGQRRVSISTRTLQLQTCNTIHLLLEQTECRPVSITVSLSSMMNQRFSQPALRFLKQKVMRCEPHRMVFWLSRSFVALCRCNHLRLAYAEYERLRVALGG